MYLLFVIEEEGSHSEKFSNLDEAMDSFKDAIGKDYNFAVALYDLEKDSSFGLSDYGSWLGRPIESWYNEDC